MAYEKTLQEAVKGFDALTGEDREFAWQMAARFNGGHMEVEPTIDHKALAMQALLSFESFVEYNVRDEDKEAARRALKLSGDDFEAVKMAFEREQRLCGHDEEDMAATRQHMLYGMHHVLTERYADFCKALAPVKALVAANREHVASLCDLEESETLDVTMAHDESALEALAQKHSGVLAFALDNGLPAHDLLGLIREAQDGNREGEFTKKANIWAEQFPDNYLVDDLRRAGRDYTVAWLATDQDYRVMDVPRERTRDLSDFRQVDRICEVLMEADPMLHANRARELAEQMEEALRVEGNRIAKAEPSQEATRRAAMTVTDRDITTVYDDMKHRWESLSTAANRRLTTKVLAGYEVAESLKDRSRAPSI